MPRGYLAFLYQIGMARIYSMFNYENITLIFQFPVSAMFLVCIERKPDSRHP